MSNLHVDFCVQVISNCKLEPRFLHLPRTVKHRELAFPALQRQVLLCQEVLLLTILFGAMFILHVTVAFCNQEYIAMPRKVALADKSVEELRRSSRGKAIVHQLDIEESEFSDEDLSTYEMKAHEAKDLTQSLMHPLQDF